MRKRMVICVIFLLSLMIGLSLTAMAAEETIASGTCGTYLEWSLDSNGLLTVRGTGEMEDYLYGLPPWESYRSSITALKLEEGIASIGREAFRNCEELKAIVVPDSVQSIGDYAFQYCRDVETIVIGRNVVSIGASAFYTGSYALKTVEFKGNAPDQVGGNAFIGSDIEDYGEVVLYYHAGTSGWTDLTWNGYRMICMEKRADWEQVSFAGGTGTKDDPYQIAAIEQLDAMRKDLDACYVLTTDLTFPEQMVWTPVGTAATPFTGSLDGAGHTISNLTVRENRLQFVREENNGWTDTHYVLYAGLFSVCDGTIKNLHLSDCDIQTASSDSFSGIQSRVAYVYCGALAGQCGSNGQILSCSSSGTVACRDIYGNTQYNYVGGLIGLLQSASVSGCHNGASVSVFHEIPGTLGTTWYTYAGGIAARANSVCVIEGCINSGSVMVQTISDSTKGFSKCYAYVGGMVGSYSRDGVLRQCANTGRVYTKVASNTADVNYYPWSVVNCGGMVGMNYGSISDCYCAADVTGISSSDSTRTVDTESNTAGIAGENCGGTISRCYYVGTASASQVYTTSNRLRSEASHSITMESSGGAKTEYCYFPDTQTETTTGCTACPAASMTMERTYAGFDFETIWTWTESGVYPYPVLVGLSDICRHQNREIPAKAPTCQRPGYHQTTHCSICGKLTGDNVRIEKTEHTAAVQDAVKPTCTEPGLTEGFYCSVCGKTLLAQTEVPAEHTNLMQQVSWAEDLTAATAIVTCGCGYEKEESCSLRWDDSEDKTLTVTAVAELDGRTIEENRRIVASVSDDGICVTLPDDASGLRVIAAAYSSYRQMLSCVLPEFEQNQARFVCAGDFVYLYFLTADHLPVVRMKIVQ